MSENLKNISHVNMSLSSFLQGSQTKPKCCAGKLINNKLQNYPKPSSHIFFN